MQKGEKSKRKGMTKIEVCKQEIKCGCRKERERNRERLCAIKGGKIKLYLNPIFGDFPRSSKNRFPHLKNIFVGSTFI